MSTEHKEWVRISHAKANRALDDLRTALLELD